MAVIKIILLSFGWIFRLTHIWWLSTEIALKSKKAPLRVHKAIRLPKKNIFGKQKTHPRSDVHQILNNPCVQHTAGGKMTSDKYKFIIIIASFGWICNLITVTVYHILRQLSMGYGKVFINRWFTTRLYDENESFVRYLWKKRVPYRRSAITYSASQLHFLFIIGINWNTAPTKKSWGFFTIQEGRIQCWNTAISYRQSKEQNSNHKKKEGIEWTKTERQTAERTKWA